MEHNNSKKERSTGKGRGAAPQRQYYGPTGTPEYPYHNPELDDGSEKGKRFPALRRTLSILGSTLTALFLNTGFLALITVCLIWGIFQAVYSYWTIKLGRTGVSVYKF